MKKGGVDEGGITAKPKERHIVTWTHQEDDILREQIRIHGTENWTIIASKFKDKTTRQCRRRWYTYLNSDFKKGGWSPEEDMLLCEAQKIFGNRWTEIAKVVSGRTDNAVKNRFSTLCKKRAKHEMLAKENSASYTNQSSKRGLFQNGNAIDMASDFGHTIKRMRRSHILGRPQNGNSGEKLLGEFGNIMHQHLRSPFSVLVQNFHHVNNSTVQQHVHTIKGLPDDAGRSNMIQGTFLKKDDPKINALMLQAELLSSLAQKVSREDTDQSLENAWKALQDFLNQSKVIDTASSKISGMNFRLEDFKDLVDDLNSSREESQTSSRQQNLYGDSPASSEYSSGSTLLSQTTVDKTGLAPVEFSGLHKDVEVGLQSVNAGEQIGCDDSKNRIHSSANTGTAEILSCEEPGSNNGIVSALLSTEFSSPPQVTPMFRSLAAGIPSPKFSESERHFLLKTFGLNSPSTNPSTNPSHPPPCKRALLKSL